MGISADDLARARAEADEYLPDPVEVLRDPTNDVERDPAGGVVDNDYGAAEGFDGLTGRLENRKQAQYEEAGAIRVREVAILKLPAGTDVLESDHVRVGGKEWNVVGVERREWEVYRVLSLEEV